MTSFGLLLIIISMLSLFESITYSLSTEEIKLLTTVN